METVKQPLALLDHLSIKMGRQGELTPICIAIKYWPYVGGPNLLYQFYLRTKAGEFGGYTLTKECCMVGPTYDPRISNPATTWPEVVSEVLERERKVALQMLRLYLKSRG